MHLLSGWLLLGCAENDAYEHESGSEHDTVAMHLSELGEVDEQQAQEVGDGSTTLLEVEAKGATVAFVETEPGFVLVTSSVPDGRPNPLADPATKEMDVIELYQHLTGSPAPDVLLGAHLRVLELSKDLTDEDSSTFGVLEQVLSDGDFFATRCGDYQVCALNMTAEREWGDYRVLSAGGYLNTVHGAVSLQIRHRRVRDWGNDQHRRVPAGVDYQWRYESPRAVRFRLKVKVYELEPGGVYHFSLYTIG